MGFTCVHAGVINPYSSQTSSLQWFFGHIKSYCEFQLLLCVCSLVIEVVDLDLVSKHYIGEGIQCYN